jgi:hypothetical protein
MKKKEDDERICSLVHRETAPRVMAFIDPLFFCGDADL